MVSLEYKMIVLKMLRKMPDSSIYVVNLDHPNSYKFIEAIKIFINQRWTHKFKKPFDLTFNTSMTKVRKDNLPCPGIWQPYFDRMAEKKKLAEKNII